MEPTKLQIREANIDMITSRNYHWFLTIHLTNFITLEEPDEVIEKFIKMLNNRVNKRNKKNKKLLQFALSKETGSKRKKSKCINPHYHLLINKTFDYLSEDLFRKHILYTAKRTIIPDDNEYKTTIDFLSGKTTWYLDLKSIYDQNHLTKYITKEFYRSTQEIYITPPTPDHYYPLFYKETTTT